MKMKLLKMLGSIIAVALYLLGVLNLYLSDKTNYCLMTFMFEYPQFVRISMPENKILYPQYELYAYSEGRFTERARKMWFDGVPVLFLPGNAGSHMQARSLASVALRKALSKQYTYHFDYFTINYNEELSGLYGGGLQSQTEFAAECIKKILSLYKDNKYTKAVPNSVILIGHSMGGVIAKRLLAYPDTLNTTSIGIVLAAPILAPVMNMDVAMDEYYGTIRFEWENYIYKDDKMKEKKILISLGNGPRDVLVPSGLTLSNDSYLNALTTGIPGVWASPDHVSIVWCKQLVMAINRFMFSIIDPLTEQIVENSYQIKNKAKQYFQANRQMILTPGNNRHNISMIVDAFWYEDNRRIYQISRPHIDKTTYLMIRLVRFPQNRFVAVQSVNVDDKDWIFGCNAKYTHTTYRYCKEAMPLTELTRWTGAATNNGKRKLATVNLHKIKEQYPDWSHVVVKVSPTRKPIVLNVDINDHASRVIYVDVPRDWNFGTTVIKEETEEDSLYYELVLRDFHLVHQAYLLHVVPTANCKASQYHVSAELHVPWAENNEYFHYFTQLKHNPMKLRLFKSNPNVTASFSTTEHVKITLLLDPQCTYTISISTSWYLRLAQLARHYSPVLVPYVAALLMMAVRKNVNKLYHHGKCSSMQTALMSDEFRPFYVLMLSKIAPSFVILLPFSMITDNAAMDNMEINYFMKSLLVLPAAITALGILHIATAVILALMVFSSQIAHRFLFRIMWGGGVGLAEHVASGVQKVPMVVSISLILAALNSCGAAALVAGAAFYAFMISKMYEEYLEDYMYKVMVKYASRVCYMFKRKRTTRVSIRSRIIASASSDLSAKDGNDDVTMNNKEPVGSETEVTSEKPCDDNGVRKTKHDDVDEELNALNFHMMMFMMWLTVTLVNIPALLTWARNFKHNSVLISDTSLFYGLMMSAGSFIAWQIKVPRAHLRYSECFAHSLGLATIFIIVYGPLMLNIISYVVVTSFLAIAIHQALAYPDTAEERVTRDSDNDTDTESNDTDTEKDSRNVDDDKSNSSNREMNDDNSKRKKENPESDDLNTEDPNDDCNVCSESRINKVFKNLREKFSATENL